MSHRRKKSKGRALEHPEVPVAPIPGIPLNDSNDAVEVIIEIDSAHKELVRDTKGYQLSIKLRREYCNRLNRIMDWMEEFYSDHFQTILVEILPSEREEGIRFYHKMERDINYSKLSPSVFEAFLSSHMLKENGKQCSFSHIRKFFDAVLYGARQSKRYVTMEFCSRIDTFLSCVTKQVISEKRDGNTDETDSDSISRNLYEAICFWAIGTINCFVWCFTVMLWNCMARSCSIDVIGMHNMYIEAAESICF